MTITLHSLLSPVTAICSVDHFVVIAHGGVLSFYSSNRWLFNHHVSSSTIQLIKSTSPSSLFVAAHNLIYHVSFSTSNCTSQLVIKSDDLVLDLVITNDFIILGFASNYISFYNLLDYFFHLTIHNTEKRTLYSLSFLLFDSTLLVASGTHRGCVELWKVKVNQVDQIDKKISNFGQLSGHRGVIFSIDCLIKDGVINLVTCSDDRRVRLFKVSDLDCNQSNIHYPCWESLVHSSRVFRVILTYDHVISGGEDGNVFIFDLVSGKVNHVLDFSDSSSIWALTNSNYDLFIGYFDGMVRYFDMNTMINPPTSSFDVKSTSTKCFTFGSDLISFHSKNREILSVKASFKMAFDYLILDFIKLSDEVALIVGKTGTITKINFNNNECYLEIINLEGIEVISKTFSFICLNYLYLLLLINGKFRLFRMNISSASIVELKHDLSLFSFFIVTNLYVFSWSNCIFLIITSKTGDFVIGKLIGNDVQVVNNILFSRLTFINSAIFHYFANNEIIFYLSCGNCILNTKFDLNFNLLWSSLLPIPKPISFASFCGFDPINQSLLIAGFGSGGRIRYFINSIEVFNHSGSGQFYFFDCKFNYESESKYLINSHTAMESSILSVKNTLTFPDFSQSRAHGRTISDCQLLIGGKTKYLVTVGEDFLMRICSFSNFNDPFLSCHSIFGNFRCLASCFFKNSYFLFVGGSSRSINVYRINLENFSFQFVCNNKPSKSQSKSRRSTSLIRIEDFSLLQDSDSIFLVVAQSNGQVSLYEFDPLQSKLSIKSEINHSINQSSILSVSSLIQDSFVYLIVGSSDGSISFWKGSLTSFEFDQIKMISSFHVGGTNSIDLNHFSNEISVLAVGDGGDVSFYQMIGDSVTFCGHYLLFESAIRCSRFITNGLVFCASWNGSVALIDLSTQLVYFFEVNLAQINSFSHYQLEKEVFHFVIVGDGIASLTLDSSVPAEGESLEDYAFPAI
ncbi:hypothetical protein P9112_012980 [Eukaryota sp. TZLM1-RC]